MLVRHIDFEYQHGLRIADLAIEGIYNTGKHIPMEIQFTYFFEQFEDDILHKLVNPHRHTIIHMYLKFIYLKYSSFFREEVSKMDIEYIFNYVLYLKLLGFNKELEGFHLNCDYCKECKGCQKMMSSLEDIHDSLIKNGEGIIQAAFHILIQNKPLLREIHTQIADMLEYEDTKQNLKNKYEKYIDVKTQNIKHPKWPVWLKQGLLFRDKGVCVVCRKDLTGLYNSSLDLNIDHIVPLANGGNNDPTNLQIMCETHNKKKLHHASTTTSTDVPLWDLLQTPQNLKCNWKRETNVVNISWDYLKKSPRSKEEIKYILKRDDEVIYKNSKNKFRDNKVNENEKYKYEIIAVDEVLGESLPSLIFCKTI